jgi:hypothetical protein
MTFDLVKRVVEEFEWPVEYKLENDLPDGILMHFPTSSVLFFEESFGRADLDFLIEDSGLDFPLSLVHAFSVLVPGFLQDEYDRDDVNLEKTEGMDPSTLKMEREIRNLCKLLQNSMLPFIRGDHTWVNEYRELFNNTNLIRQVIGMDDDHYYKHPIYQKLIRKDPTWKDDLLQLQQHGA